MYLNIFTYLSIDVLKVIRIKKIKILILRIFGRLNLVTGHFKKKGKRHGIVLGKGLGWELQVLIPANLNSKGIYWKIVKYLIALMERLENLVQKTGRNKGIKRPGITAKVIPPEDLG